jgi:hypothetical protein
MILNAEHIKRDDWVTGECLCHGVVVTGRAGTVAQPAPYRHRLDAFKAATVWCWAVSEDNSNPHDVPIKNLFRSPLL